MARCWLTWRREVLLHLSWIWARVQASLRALKAEAHPWRLIDQDAKLLAEAQRRHGQSGLLTTYRLDLQAIGELPLAEARLVTASALFDLVSAEFIQRLVAQFSSQGAALYANLIYDGTTQWLPAHPLDELILRTFNQDQRGDKGFGPALGPEATVFLEQTLLAAHYRVSLAASPWRLDAQHQGLVEALIQSYAEVAAGAVGQLVERPLGQPQVTTSQSSTALTPQDIDAWREFRLANSAHGTCVLGHWDLFAIPKSHSNAQV